MSQDSMPSSTLSVFTQLSRCSNTSVFRGPASVGFAGFFGTHASGFCSSRLRDGWPPRRFGDSSESRHFRMQQVFFAKAQARSVRLLWSLSEFFGAQATGLQFSRGLRVLRNSFERLSARGRRTDPTGSFGFRRVLEAAAPCEWSQADLFADRESQARCLAPRWSL